MLKSISVTICLLATLSGCASLLKPKEPPMRNFSLETVRTAPALPQPIFQGRLLVRNFSTAPMFNTRNLVYRLQPDVYDTDYYNLFLIDPGEIIAQQTREWIRSAGLFTAVLSPSNRLEHEYTLEGHILSLYGDFAGARYSADMRIQFFLLHSSRGESKIVLEKEYAARVPVAQRDPALLVKGYNAALRSILTSLVQDLIQLAKTAEGKSG